MKSTALLLAVCALTLGGTPQQNTPRFERSYELRPEEGVFAYSRISPDGRYLAYASENTSEVAQMQTVVDLATKKVLFTEPGIDAYWSNDGTRMIFLSMENGGVSIRHHATGAITRSVAPAALGDYFSWSVRDGRNMILTINSNYYYLNGDRAVLPHARVPSCDGIGVGERPLISKDGLRATTFVRGTVVVRSLSDCSYILDTGMPGAKADFSFDGRYIAFHSPKASGAGYDIQVVDLERRTVRTVTNMRGSSYFPSWTRDGRLSFRYDGPEYRGFMMASNVLSAAERPLPTKPARVPSEREWSDVFPETPKPSTHLALVTVWGTWSAHSPMALSALQQARDHFGAASADVGFYTATDPGSLASDIERLLTRHHIGLARIPLAPERLFLTEAHNQIPTTLLFKDGRLVDRRLGAQTFEALREWVAGVGSER